MNKIKSHKKYSPKAPNTLDCRLLTPRLSTLLLRSKFRLLHCGIGIFSWYVNGSLILLHRFLYKKISGSHEKLSQSNIFMLYQVHHRPMQTWSSFTQTYWVWSTITNDTLLDTCTHTHILKALWVPSAIYSSALCGPLYSSTKNF